jgi:branched-chain amino acid transport system permease protein
VLGAVLVVFFLESTRFVVPLIPGITAVQGAALRELMISVVLLVILRFYAKGLMPERLQHPALPDEAAATPARA